MGKTNPHREEEMAKGVLGKLSMISLPELTQTISSNQRTGVLNLYRGEESAEVHFKDGQIVNATCAGTEGPEAFYGVLAWSDGDFRFSPGEVTGERKIMGDPMGLLMEGLRRLDEQKKVPAA